MSILGLDIGGANIKAADPAGRALSRPFAIWKHPEQLAPQIDAICGAFPQTGRIAVTMTAELADCFATKAEGVRFILDQVEAAAGHRPCQVWSTVGRFVSVDEACRQPMLVAAANWHVLATWVGKWLSTECRASGDKDQQVEKRDSAIGYQPSAVVCPSTAIGALPSVAESSGTALLIDIGTTTTDIIPIVGGRLASVGLTDVGRLQSGELSYSGVKRTPLCAVAHSVPFREGYCSLAAELFATTLDVHLLLGDIAGDERDLETANGKPATVAAAHDRIARQLCGDRDEVSFDDAVQIARFLADVQRQRLAGALDRVIQRLPGRCESVVVSGSGSFLARRLIADNRRLSGARVVSLDELMSPGIAESACAYAVAELAKSDAVTG
jgi:probable H4MPT-linked C1 transfer pathway protein